MNPNKKYLILIVRRTSSEIDYILPLIYKLSNNLELVTLFSDQRSFENFKQNKLLFGLWKKKCRKFFIIKKRDKITFKLFLKIFHLINFKKSGLLKKLELLIIKNTFDLTKFLNYLQIEKKQIKLIFVPINNLSSLPLIFKLNIPDLKIIKFPESQNLNPHEKKGLISKNRRSFVDNFTDFYLINEHQNINFFLGSKINNEIKKKIIFCKFFKYENWWIKKLKKKSNLNKKIITVFTRQPDDVTLSVKSFVYYIDVITKIFKEFNDFKVVFKVSPTISLERKLILETLKNKKEINWKIDTGHAIEASSISNFCITILTSACLDCLAMKKKVIELFDYSRESIKANAIFLSRKKKWVSIYSKKKLVVSAKNEKELRSIIKKIVLKKKLSKFDLSQKKFKNLTLNGNDTSTISKNIVKII